MKYELKRTKKESLSEYAFPNLVLGVIILWNNRIKPNLLFNSMSDVKPPSILSFEISAPVVDLSSGDASLRFKIGSKDDISGVDSISVGWKSPSGDQNFYLNSSGSDSLISGTNNDGIWRSYSNDLNRYSESGVWRVSYLDVRDKAGNSKDMKESILQSLALTVHLSDKCRKFH